MAFGVTGRRSIGLAAILLVGAGLSACTTTDGTNALTDFGTFDREVMNETAQGLGIIPREVKPDPEGPRAPLVLPKDKVDLPAPTTAPADAGLPVDSDKVTYNIGGMSEAEVAQLKAARIVDVNTLGGRPLTDKEIKQLTARMKAARISTTRSIFLPPASYYTTVVDGPDLVCLAANGDLVSVSDAACPPEIRKALLKQ